MSVLCHKAISDSPIHADASLANLLELVIADLAAAKRAPGRTRKEGYDDFVTRDGLGVELCRLLVTAPVVQQ
jgi:hypothetical protein